MVKTKIADGRRKLVVLIGLGIFILAVVFAVYNRSVRIAERVGGEVERNEWPVDVRTVAGETFVERIHVTGILEPMENATLNAEVSAKVVGIRADLGDSVSKGQPLVLLDRSNYTLVKNNAEAALASAKTSARLAAENYQRAQKLAKAGHLSQVQLDEIRTAHEAAQAGLRQAEVALNMAQRNLRETTIRAPFAGRVSVRLSSLGELVAPGTPIITVVRDRVLRLDIALAETDIMRIRTGMKAEVTLPSLPGRTFAGEVTRFGAAANRASGAFPVRVELDNRNGELLSGMRAAASLELARSEGAIVVTRDQVVSDNGDDVVYVVVEAGGQDVAQARKVTLGSRDGQRVRIIDGLAVGDLLVVVGQRSLQNGSRVEIVTRDGERIEPPKEEPAAEPEPEQTPAPADAEAEG